MIACALVLLQCHYTATWPVVVFFGTYHRGGEYHSVTAKNVRLVVANHCSGSENLMVVTTLMCLSNCHSTNILSRHRNEEMV